MVTAQYAVPRYAFVALSRATVGVDDMRSGDPEARDRAAVLLTWSMMRRSTLKAAFTLKSRGASFDLGSTKRRQHETTSAQRTAWIDIDDDQTGL